MLSKDDILNINNIVYDAGQAILDIYDTAFEVEIKSDIAKWFKNDNKLIFTSNEKQVETTIKFLLTK